MAHYINTGIRQPAIKSMKSEILDLSQPPPKLMTYTPAHNERLVYNLIKHTPVYEPLQQMDSTQFSNNVFQNSHSKIKTERSSQDLQQSSTHSHESVNDPSWYGMDSSRTQRLMSNIQNNTNINSQPAQLVDQAHLPFITYNTLN